MQKEESDMLMKKLNLALCILIVLVFLGQMFMIVFEPYYRMKETNQEYPQKFQDEGQKPKEYDIGLFEMVWLKFHNGAAILGLQEYGGWGDNLAEMIDDAGIYKETVTEIDENGNEVETEVYVEYENDEGEMVRYISAEDVFERNSNLYVLGVVGVTVLGLVVLVMTIFSRKSIVLYAFTLVWAGVSLWGFVLADNPILNNPAIATPYALSTILPTLKILSIAAVVLTLARAYPVINVRFLQKKKQYYMQ